jgi:glucuronate isomerase
MKKSPLITDDFLLETEQACELFHQYAKTMPIVDYHCHLNPAQIAADIRYRSMTEVWLGGDH